MSSPWNPEAEPLNRIGFSGFGLKPISRPNSSREPWKRGRCYSRIGQDTDYWPSRVPCCSRPGVLLIANFPQSSQGQGHVVENLGDGESTDRGNCPPGFFFTFLFAYFTLLFSHFSLILFSTTSSLYQHNAYTYLS
jgi:hypothetical protein